VIPTIAPYLLPHLLLALRRARPDYELHLWEAQTTVLLQRLRSGELDLCLLALPVEGEDLVTQELGTEPFALLLPRGHRLADRRALRQADLAGEQVLLLEDGHCLRTQALEVCSLAGAHEAPEVHASSLATVVQMVANGQGITLLPATAIAVEVRSRRGLVLRTFAEPAPARVIGLVWRRGAARANDHRAVAALFRTEIGQRIEEARSI
jgi:LysR family transcriptional regulator, hydrogen peroxide-inducible genes activator